MKQMAHAIYLCYCIRIRDSVLLQVPAVQEWCIESHFGELATNYIQARTTALSGNCFHRILAVDMYALQ